MRKPVNWERSSSSIRGKSKDMPAFRNSSHEKTICDAISKRLCVEFRYKTDLYSRSYEPHALYHAETDNVLVTGLQTENPNKPFAKPDVHDFIVGNISDLRIIKSKIAADASIDRSDERFKNGIICSI